MNKLILSFFIILTMTGFAWASGVIVIYHADNTVAVIHPVYSAQKANESDIEFLERVRAGSGLENLPYEIMDSSLLPDRAYREKWRKDNGGGIKIDHLFQTKAEKHQAIQDDIDMELEKENPDLKKILKLQRKLDKGDY